jgi:hypothetical protein
MVRIIPSLHFFKPMNICLHESLIWVASVWFVLFLTYEHLFILIFDLGFFFNFL